MGESWLTAAEWEAVRLSLLVAVTATVASLPFGILLGRLLARRPFHGKALLETVINLPLVLPPVVTGYLLLVLFGRKGLIGRYLHDWFGLAIAFNWKGAALASAVMAFPLMVRSIRIAVAGVDERLEQAARTLGAGPWETFGRITLPLARRGISAAAVLGFARCLGEFGATIMLAGNVPGETQTVALYIYSQANAPGGMEQSGRLVVMAILIAATALGVSEWLERSSAQKGTQRKHG
jgi:molybdate transport system permease protein